MDKFFHMILTQPHGRPAIISATMLAETEGGAKAAFNGIPEAFWALMDVPYYQAVGALLTKERIGHHSNVGNVDPGTLTRSTVLITTHPDNYCFAPRQTRGYIPIMGTSGGEGEFIDAFLDGSGITTVCQDCQQPLTVVGAFTKLEEV